MTAMNHIRSSYRVEQRAFVMPVAPTAQPDKADVAAQAMTWLQAALNEYDQGRETNGDSYVDDVLLKLLSITRLGAA